MQHPSTYSVRVVSARPSLSVWLSKGIVVRLRPGINCRSPLRENELRELLVLLVFQSLRARFTEALLFRASIDAWSCVNPVGRTVAWRRLVHLPELSLALCAYDAFLSVMPHSAMVAALIRVLIGNKTERATMDCHLVEEVHHYGTQSKAKNTVSTNGY